MRTDKITLAELESFLLKAADILRGKMDASEFKLNVPNIKSNRESTGLSQAKFVSLLGVSIGTVQDWEQGRRAPSGAARTLLEAISIIPMRLALEKMGR